MKKQKLVFIGEGQCHRCGNIRKKIYGPAKSIRRDFDVYLCEKCGGRSLSVEEARRGM